MKTQPLDDVVAHWSKLYEGFHTSSEKFYDAVEDALERREVPGIAVSSLVLNEGGLLSPNRSYLRVRADRLIFDICAAPFGTGFFFSWWLAQKRAQWVSVYLVGIALGTWFTFRAFQGSIASVLRTASTPFTFFMGLVVLNPFVLGPLALVLVLWGVALLARGGMTGPEDAVLTVPLLGPVYGRYFAPTTYHRLDTIGMFRASVQA